MHLYCPMKACGGGQLIVSTVLASTDRSRNQLSSALEGMWPDEPRSLFDGYLQLLVVDELHYYSGLLGR